MDKTIRLVYEVPSPKDYNFLRETIGWKPYPEEDIQVGLNHTLFCVCAKRDSETLGMVRVVGDGRLIFYIQDMIVLPEFQGQGIGKRLMLEAVKFIRDNSVNHSVIGLMSVKGKEGFYEKFGFTSRPNEKLGPGMTVFLEKDH